MSVCKKWHELAGDNHLLREQSRRENLRAFDTLISDLQVTGCDPTLLKRVTEDREALENVRWRGLPSVDDGSLLPDLHSFSPQTLASFPPFPVELDASELRTALFNTSVRAWEKHCKSPEDIRTGPIGKIEEFSGPAALSFLTANKYELPGNWNWICEDGMALNERELRALTAVMCKYVCRLNKLIVHTVGRVNFSAIKNFLTATGKLRHLESFHFLFNCPCIQSKEFWNHLLKSLSESTTLVELGFQLTPRNRKGRPRKSPWVAQMRDSLRKMALNDPFPIFSTLKVRGAHNSTVLEVLKAVTNTCVTKLHLNDGKITLSEAWELGALLANDNTLHTLSLENCRLTQKAIRIIVGWLQKNRSLQYVSLKGNQVITDDDLLELVQKLRGRGLEIHLTAPPQR